MILNWLNGSTSSVFILILISIQLHDMMNFTEIKKLKKNPDESDFYDEKGKVLIINNEYNREKKWVAIYTWKSVQIFLI